MTDILMIDSGDGGNFTFLNGDIEGDDTFYTAVYLSLFSGDSFYNVFLKYPKNKEFEDSLNCIITTDNLKTIETNGNTALDWMIQEGIAESIDTYAYSSSQKQTNVEITITKPDGDVKQFGIIWDNQIKSLLQFGVV